MNNSKFNPLSSSIIKRGLNPTAIPLNLFNSAPSRVVVGDRYECLPPQRGGRGGGVGEGGGGINNFHHVHPWREEGEEERVCAGSFIIASDRNEFLNGCSIHTTHSDRGVLKRGFCYTVLHHSVCPLVGIGTPPPL